MLTDQAGNKITEGRKYDADNSKREYYSEDEIFKLHEEGKILLLASVKKLQRGYDCPRDSILFDLMDRYSKVEATQIDGRVFRRDKNDPEKLATVINLIDKNTHDLYKNHPQLYPIHCAEVIQGAEFRLPMKRDGSFRRSANPPPDVDLALEHAGFELITNREDVGRIIAEHVKVREKSAEKAPEGWLSARMLTENYVGNDQDIVKKMQQLHKELGESAEGIIGEFCSSRGQLAFYINPEHVVLLDLQRKNELNPPPTGWLSPTMIKKDYVGGHTEITKKMQQLHKELGESAEDVIGEFDSDKGKTHYINPVKVHLLKLKPKSQVKPPPEGGLSAAMISKSYVGNRTQVNNKMEQLYEELGESAEGIIGKFDMKGVSVLYINPDHIDQLGLKKREKLEYLEEILADGKNSKAIKFTEKVRSNGNNNIANSP